MSSISELKDMLHLMEQVSGTKKRDEALGEVLNELSTTLADAQATLEKIAAAPQAKPEDSSAAMVEGMRALTEAMVKGLSAIQISVQAPPAPAPQSWSRLQVEMDGPGGKRSFTINKVK